MEIPTVIATKTKRAGHIILKVQCPFCGKSHEHGIEEGKTFPILRTAHCKNIEGRSYYINV